MFKSKRKEKAKRVPKKTKAKVKAKTKLKIKVKNAPFPPKLALKKKAKKKSLPKTQSPQKKSTSLFHPQVLKEIKKAHKIWEQNCLQAQQKKPERSVRFTTLSDMEVPLLSTPLDLEASGFDYLRDSGFPGQYPFTRGVQPNMYRGKLWTMRQFAGFASAEETNARFQMLLKNGQTGLSTAFDMPTLMGLDADHSRSKGEVGKCGVSVSSLEDMEKLFEGISLADVTTSMTINAPAIVILCMYFAVAEKQGVPRHQVRGTLQNDILKEYIAQKEWIYPVEPAVRLVIDTIEYCTQHYPQWNTVSISGYHIREAGATAVQELAFTLADGLTYVEECIARGMKVDDFAPRLSFFFDIHNDFFEEIAKLRAARRIWARLMKERFKAQDPRSWMLRTHAQTAGVSLTAQQPYNNIVRVALQGMAAILGGTNSLHTNSMDETLALPTDESVMIALRTQQIIAEESGVAHVVDPFGGSYFMETLTTRMEKEALEFIRKIEEKGGMIKAIEEGYPQSELANSAYHFQRQLEKKEKVMVGVNRFQMDEPKNNMKTMTINKTIEEAQRKKLAQLRQKRSQEGHQKAMDQILSSAREGKNMMESVLEAVKAYATVQEICDALRTVYGEYQETGSF